MDESTTEDRSRIEALEGRVGDLERQFQTLAEEVGRAGQAIAILQGEIDRLVELLRSLPGVPDAE